MAPSSSSSPSSYSPRPAYTAPSSQPSPQRGPEHRPAYTSDRPRSESSPTRPAANTNTSVAPQRGPDNRQHGQPGYQSRPDQRRGGQVTPQHQPGPRPDDRRGDRYDRNERRDPTRPLPYYGPSHPYRPYDPYHRPSYHPPRGTHVRHLPPLSVRLFIGGLWFWRYGDCWYRPWDDGYIVVAPPVSAPVYTVPASDEIVLLIDGVEYLVIDGQCFLRTASGLVWVQTPYGALVPELPPRAQSVWYGDIEYFDCSGIILRKTPDGYRIVETPWGRN